MVVQLKYVLALWRAPKIGPKKFFALAQKHADLAELFALDTQALSRYGLTIETIQAIKNPPWQQIEQDLAWSEKPNHHIITWRSPYYPALLKEIDARPPLLFCRGNPAFLNNLQLAMVGSRNPSIHGKAIARSFAHALTELGFSITSGLALGIDAASHQGALAAKGSTIAVLGTGIDMIYPKRHRPLADAIAASGALISEFPTGLQAFAANFPRRNRIISGLSQGTLVVEAALRSGSLITAAYANKQGREVFAMPGSIHNPLAKGCHQLIQQGAKLVESVTDIMEELNPSSLLKLKSAGKKQTCSPFCSQQGQSFLTGLAKEQVKLLQSLDFQAVPIDNIVARTGFSLQKVMALLLDLELSGHVCAVAGGYMACRGSDETTII